MIVLIFCALVLITLKANAEFDYLDKDKTQAVRGIMAIAICFSHNISEQPWFYIQRWLFPATVSLFFFYSAFGMMISVVKTEQDNGTNLYVKDFWRKRLPRIMFVVLIPNFIKLLLSSGIQIKWNKNTLLSLLNPGWFIMALLVYYLGFWLIYMRKLSSDYIANHIMILVYLLAYIIICRKLGLSSFWYGNSFAFLLGLLWGGYRERIDIFFGSSPQYAIQVAVIVILLSVCNATIILVELGIISIHGPGMLAAFLIGVLYPILWNLIMYKTSFRVDFWIKIGNMAIEMLMVEGISQGIVTGITTFCGLTVGNSIRCVLLVIIECLLAYVLYQFSSRIRNVFYLRG